MTVSLTSTRKRLGVLTPSSNTVLEPVIVGLTAGLPNLSLHFTRFRVTEISLSEAGLSSLRWTRSSKLLDFSQTLESTQSAGAALQPRGWDSTTIARCAPQSSRIPELRPPLRR